MSNIKSFEIRWSDLDPNRHVANSTYSALMNERRMTYLNEHGFTQSSFEKYKIGPVVFFEEFHYLKEILPGEKVYVDMELLASSTDHKFSKWSHSLFNQNGKLAVYSEILCSWFDLTERKLTVPPAELIDILLSLPKADNFEIITEQETRRKVIPKKELKLE